MASKSIIFVDSRVSDYQSLIDALTESSEVFVLNGDSDGLSQMAEALQGRTDIDALHVISHGSEGALYLGNTVLNNSSLSLYRSQLATIGGALTETGDILLYGCNVAQGSVGTQFVASLAQYMGADVAASNDLTGAAALGGDWVLEQATGNVQSFELYGTSLTGLLAANTAPTFFVGTGKVTTDVRPLASDFGESVALQRDGKILLGGRSEITGNADFALVRYNPDGSLDTTFGSDGVTTTDFGREDHGVSLAIQGDGKILLGGYSNGVTYRCFALARYNRDGSLDTSFNGDGKLTTVIGTGDADGQSVTVQSDGKILLAGFIPNGTSFALARYNQDGSLDTAFDGDGMIITEIGGGNAGGKASVALQADGKILVGGGADDFVLVRYNTNGSLDTTFSGDGKVTTDFGINSRDRGNSVTVQTDGKILLGGYTDSTFYLNFALARYNTDGSLDTSFSGDGKLTTGFGRSNETGTSVALQSDGKILLTGSTDGDSTVGPSFALARYNPNGSLDVTFSDDGMVTTDVGPLWDHSNSVKVQTNGNILLGGRSESTGSLDFALVRYNPDGSLDTTFSPPANTLTASPTYTENNDSMVLNANVQVLDAELATANNYNGATLTLTRHSNASAQDVFSAKSSGALTTLTTNSYFAVDSVTIGRVTTNSAGILTLAFNANATQSLVNKAMQQIAYSNSSDAPPATVQIDWTFSDGNTGAQGTGGAMTVTGSTTVQITATNDAPILSTALPDQNHSANTLYSYKIPSNTFTDPDLEELTYVASMANGTGIPPWLTFEGSTRTFTGTPTIADAAILDIKVTAKDASSYIVFDTFRLNVVAATNQALVGTNSSDSLVSGKGNDTIDGGAGADTAIYSGKITDYFIKYNRALGTATITDHRASGDGTDTLKSIEKLQFADKLFDLINPVRTEAPVHSKSQSFLFDPSFYLLKNPDLVPTVTLATAFDNYKSKGAAQGAAPNAWFDSVYYANKWADLKALNLDAATLFAHYNLFGVWEGRSAGPTFDKYDGARYLKDNPDVAAYVDGNVADFLGSRSNGAIAHYVIYGAAEGRVAYDTSGVAIEQAILIGVPG